MKPKDQTAQQESFLTDFPHFVGKLLHAVTATHPASSQKEMPAPLANLWLAASASLGLTVLTVIVKESPQLQELLEQYTNHPIQEDHALHASKLSLGSTLHSLSSGLAIDADSKAQQQQYLYLFERLEEDFQALQQERDALHLDPEELATEIQELFASTLYSLTRLQRP
ncbi:MAG: hypothetical protein H6728_05650 [Myxococcales bacterium]|nr:hypothetical protein [Myxococcales bacterium]MCB9642541.1 hypothetical protein [Myxococcales bacterium]